MEMIIGGAYQGKLAYAKKQNPYIHWTDGELCEGDNIFEAEGGFHFEKYIHPGAIPLIHNISKSNTEALDTVLTNLEKEGYTFHSLSDLKKG